MATELKMQLLLRRDSVFAESYKLAAGEPGFEISTNTLKIGDGEHTWKDLPIANKGEIDSLISTAISGHAAGYYTKGEVDGFVSELTQLIDGVRSDLTAETTARTNADTDLQNQINTKLASDTFNTWKGTHETDHAKTATEITNEINTAVSGETSARETAINGINSKIGDVTSGKTVVGMISDAEESAKSHAESKASDAYDRAVAEAESKDVARASAIEGKLNSAVSTLEGKISSGDTTTLNDAKAYVDQEIGKEKSRAEGAESGLNTRLEKVEAFFTTKDAEGKDVEIDKALDTLVEIQKYITEDGTAAGQMVERIGQAESDIDALEGDMTTVKGNIETLGTNKLDKSVYDAYIVGKSMSDEDLKGYADGVAATAKSEAITEAGKLDNALHTVISKEIDDDVKAAIEAEVSRANGAYDAKDSAATALSDAKLYTNTQIETLNTTINGELDKKATIETVTGIDGRLTTVEGKVSTVEGKVSTLEGKVSALEGTYSNSDIDSAISAAVAAEESRAKGEEEKLSNAITSGDATTLQSAKDYVDGKVTDAHKAYSTGTVKDASHDSATDPSFITSVTIEKGHITGATVRNLAEVLAAMEFIFDGGNSSSN